MALVVGAEYLDPRLGHAFRLVAYDKETVTLVDLNDERAVRQQTNRMLFEKDCIQRLPHDSSSLTKIQQAILDDLSEDRPLILPAEGQSPYIANMRFVALGDALALIARGFVTSARAAVRGVFWVPERSSKRKTPTVRSKIGELRGERPFGNDVKSSARIRRSTRKATQ